MQNIESQMFSTLIKKFFE